MESKERLEILAMVAEKKITVEEAERLLAALAEGDRLAAEARRGGRRRDAGSNPLQWLDGVVDEIGPMVSTVVSDVMGSVDSILDMDEEEDPSAAVSMVKTLRLEPGTELLVAAGQRRFGPVKSSTVSIRAVPGVECSIVNDGPGVHITHRGKQLVIRADKGDVRISAPNVLASIDVRHLHGDIQVQGFNAAVALKTMGGAIILKDMEGSARVKTMGGHIKVIGYRPRDDARFVSMGGNIDVTLPGDLSARIQALTMGGVLDVDKRLGTVSSRPHIARQQAVLLMGDGASSVSFKTMGGNIVIRCAGDADADAVPATADHP
ncbi:hypothetical protein JW905_06595 [bacterium]|nr:hypothetical protein [candidate division CSSED10-310 bacterium]